MSDFKRFKEELPSKEKSLMTKKMNIFLMFGLSLK